MQVAMHNWMRAEPVETTIRRLAKYGYDGIEISYDSVALSPGAPVWRAGSSSRTAAVVSITAFCMAERQRPHCS